MLSDELLSIKQHIYEKEGRYVSDRTVSKSSVPTPTLEIKQKWPVIDFLSKLNKIKNPDQYVKQGNNVDNELTPDYTETNERSTIAISTYMEEENNSLSHTEQIKEEKIRQELLVQKIKGRKSLPKVIGLRSLYQNTDERQLKNNRRCSCDNKNSITFEPLLAGSSTHKCSRCTHGEELPCESACTQTSTSCPLTTCSHTSACATIPSSTPSDNCGKCTRVSCTSTGCSTRVSYTAFPFYMPFQYPMQTANPIAYYYTTQLDYGFTREPKHRSTKRRKVDYYYYDDSKEDDYLEYSIKKETRSPVKGSCRDVVLKVDYTDKVQNRPDKLCDGVYDVNKNKFLNEIVQDLKMYYPEAVVKDCYCKSSSVQSILSFYLILIVFFSTFYFF